MKRREQDDVDVLARELKIASEAARKLSVALSIAWAILRKASDSGSLCSNEKGVTPHEDQKGGAPLGPLPF